MTDDLSERIGRAILEDAGLDPQDPADHLALVARAAEETTDEDTDRGHPEEDHDDREHRPPAGAQRGEEARPRHDTDGVGEEDEAERADDLGHEERDVSGRARGGDPDRGEEHGSRAEVDPLDAHRAEDGAHREQYHEEEDRLPGEEVEYRSHGSPA